MALMPDQIDDLVNLTLNNFKRYKYTDLALQYQDYIAMRVINNKKVVEMGGPKIEFKVKVRNTGLARAYGLYQTDVTGIEDLSIAGQVPWTMQTVNWSYSIYEDMFQSDKETIVKSLLMREQSAHSDMAELQEELLWNAPTSTSDNRPMGIPFWIQKDASTTPDGAFNGGNPSGFTSGRAGISSTTYPRWRNWTFGYSAVTRDDLIRKIKKATVFTNFKSPVPTPELGYGKADWEIFTTYRVTEPMERLAEDRNDNLGKDLAKYMNQVTVAGIPITMVHYLEANDTSDPLYGVNWKVLRPFVKSGLNMKRHPPKESATQHDTRTVHIDNAMNWCCYNVRELWVGSKP